MARLAWFTPLPPVRSGIAAYNAELLPLLAGRHEIDVFTDPFDPSRQPRPSCDPQPSWDPPSGGLNTLHVFGAHDFIWKHGLHPYDLVVYQLGNAACHDFMWPHLARYPGLVVLHDGQLHHERSRALLSRGLRDEYRAEFRYNHPDAPAHLPDLVIAALGGSFYYMYPMLRWVLRTARLVAVHSGGLASQLRESHPGVEVRRIRHGMVDPLTPAAREAAGAVRARHGVPEDAVLFAAFGLVTPEKRISAGLRALARLPRGANAYLLLAGGTTDYYDAAAEARALGVEDRVRITGYVADEDLAAYVLAADACLCLRWPTSRETSGTWIRAIAAGKPTVVTDLAHNQDVPVLRLAGSEAGPGEAAVAIAVDILDEDEILYLAMARLAEDADLRRRLGDAAREYWRSHHTMDCAVHDYLAAIERGLQRPVPHVRDLPAHLTEDGLELARQLAAEMGVEIDVLRSRGQAPPRA